MLRGTFNGRAETRQTVSQRPQPGIRIPVEFELPGDEAIMHRDGDRLLIEPIRKRRLVALITSMKPLDEAFPEIEDPVPAPERVL